MTGASGFVGRNLVPALAETHQVTAVVRKPGSSVGAAREVVVPDIASEDLDWRPILAGTDVIVHLAARVHVMKDTASNPLEEFRKANTDATMRLAQQAAEVGVRRFVFMSSIKVNGERTTGSPFTNTDPARPVDPYGISKWEGEQAVRAVCQGQTMEPVILRPTVIYGPGVRGNIARIAGLVRRGIPLPLGLVRNRRTMLSIGNLIAWVKLAISSDVVGSLPTLIGDPEPVSTADLVRHLAEGMGKSARLVPFPVGWLRTLGRLARRGGDVARLTEDLEVEPSIGAFAGAVVLESSADGLRSYARLIEPSA